MSIETRPFGFWRTAALVVGGMIGAGIFVLPAQLASFGATGAAGWVIAIAGAMVLTWVCVGLISARPHATGLIAISGEALGPMIGVITGWGYWITVWTTVAVLGTSAATYLTQFFPAIGAQPAYVVLCGVAILWVFTLVNLAGARTVGAVQVVTTVLKLLPLVAIVAILAGLLIQGGAAFNATPHPPFSAATLPSAVNLIFFALLGFESAGIAAERVRDPARTIPRATLAGVALTGLLYLIVCSGVVFALPQDQLAASPAPMALFVETYWGAGAALAIAGFAAVAAIGCLNGWVLIQGEVPLGMARAGLLPAWIGKTDKRDVPRGLILASSGLATVLLLLSISKSTADLFDFMLRLTTTTGFYAYAAFCLAALVMKVRRIAAAIGLIFSLWAIWGAGLEGAGLSLLLMLTAVPLYWFRPKGSGVAAEQPA